MDDDSQRSQSSEAPLPQTKTPTDTGSHVAEAVLDVMAGFGLALLMVIVVLVVAVIAGWDANAAFTSGPGVAAWVLVGQLALLMVALRRRRVHRLAGRPLLPLFGGPIGAAILRGVLTAVVLVVITLLYGFTLETLLGEGSVEGAGDFAKEFVNDRLAIALLAFVMAGVAPICEEVVFRGVMFGSAHAAGRTRAGVAVSAVLFSVVHLIPLLAPIYVLDGVVLCWLYARTRTLVAPIAAHMTMNGLACAALLFGA